MKNAAVRLRVVLCLFLCLTFLFLAGCWDYKEIQKAVYTTTIGIDYSNSEYTVYMQALTFSNVAQREGERPAKHKSVIGIGTGKTLAEAFFELYKYEQQTLYWGHIMTVIIHENALRRVRVEQFIDLINRYREIRYNLWFFGTNSDIKEMLNINPDFGYSPYESVLMKPERNFAQYSSTKPVYFYRFIADFYERGKSALLPRITINNTHWQEGMVKSPQLVLEGAYFFYRDHFSGYLSSAQLIGKRYMNPRSIRMPITVWMNGKPAATLVANKPEIKHSYRIRNGKVVYDISIRLSGFIDELVQEPSEKELVEAAERKISKEVLETFRYGKKIGVDVYNLNTELFRYHYRDWQTYILPHSDISNTEIASVNVKFRLRYSGKYKNRLS
ncbi:Ger(x)C family spore germination protein [Paenibacillus sp. J5C_2022]|uniref:Ger(x)C family spore germination protein n=1 Tax=Paenibacillus sp. J5C2022 TaxID=2977129 RepID=UPI0021D3E71A|nr:Ger(x)C family spore germination protein [Paenibacillus sp. J5C2022]MCU6712956.1 Ger(x)C family spore germination protein [Paenibacillus sp. J5C2022]